jgi:hypothetical protein
MISSRSEAVKVSRAPSNSSLNWPSGFSSSPTVVMNKFCRLAPFELLLKWFRVSQAEMSGEECRIYY